MWIPIRVIGAEKRGRQKTLTRDLQARSGGICLVLVLLVVTTGAGCSPRVKVEAPDKPIEINVNVKIDQEVRIKLDKEVESALQENPELFGTETKP